MAEKDRLSQSLDLTGNLVAELIALLKESEHLSADISRMNHRLEVLERDQKWLLDATRNKTPNVVSRLDALEAGEATERASKRNAVTLIVAVISFVGVLALAAAQFWGP